MKIINVCMKCHQEYGSIFTAFNELNDKGFYKVVCPNGHISYNYLTAKKFEIFFDIGLHAFLDGYPDASVSRFAVSLERFYEFCIQVWYQLKFYIKIYFKLSQKIISSFIKNITL